MESLWKQLTAENRQPFLQKKNSILDTWLGSECTTEKRCSILDQFELFTKILFMYNFYNTTS